MSRSLLFHRRRYPAVPFDTAEPLPPDDPDDDLILLGQHSISTSLVDYPKTPSTTVGNYYVDATNGNDNNTGTSVNQAFRTIQKAYSVASSGDTILVRQGNYILTSALMLNKSNIRLWNYGTERPTLNRNLGGTTTGEGAYGIRVTAGNNHIKGFELVGVPERSERLDSCLAIHIIAPNTKVEDIWVHSGRTGSIYCTTGSNGSLVQDCIVWNNRQVNLPSQATNSWDGMVVTNWSHASEHTSNVTFVRCLVANAGDDGFDLWGGRNCKIIDCVSIGAGIWPNGVSSGGDAGGFKLGGATGGAGGNTLQGSIAFGCRETGINSNGTKWGTNTIIYNTATRNNRGMRTLGDTNAPNTRNNIVVNNPTSNSLHSSNRSHNTFDLGISNAGFANTGEADYSLGPGSACISAGTNIGGGGTNLGASDVALKLLKTWLPRADIAYRQ